jgi:hypothetical protein
MEPVYRLVALRGSPQRRSRGTAKSLKERDNYVLEDNFLEDFTKKSGAKITLYPSFFL